MSNREHMGTKIMLQDCPRDAIFFSFRLFIRDGKLNICAMKIHSAPSQGHGVIDKKARGLGVRPGKLQTLSKK